MLDPQLWRTIVDSFVEDDLQFDHIIFQWLGDPSLHPALPQLLADTADRLLGRVGYLRVDTNAILLTPDKVEAILSRFTQDAPPLLIVLTLDAHTPSTYHHVKGVDALRRVQRNVRHLIRRRAATGARVNLQLQFVVQDGNAHELAPFLRYWTDLLACPQPRRPTHDEIMFKRLSVGGGGPGQAAADDLYERALESANIRPGPHRGVQIVTWERRPWQHDDGHHDTPRGPCPGLWLTPVIRHDGALLMCCADLGSTLQLGSLRDHRFSALWNGPTATHRRLRHIAGHFDDACASCGGINWYDLTPAHLKAAIARGRALGLAPETP